MATKKAAKSAGSYEGFSAEERDAMKEHAKELKARGSKAEAESAVLAKIAEMPDPDRVLAERIHAIVTANAPSLSPKTWYGMPAYANKAGKVVCFFTPAAKFKARYASFGFNEDAMLDDGTMWPTAWAVTKLTADDEKLIADLVRKAAG
jgi:uncharacterized protein YdhG (YjbR/CyaY superfamily)